MGYMTGICTTFSDIQAAFTDVLTAAGWSRTTDSAGKTVMYKDTLYAMLETLSDCFRVTGRTGVNEGDAFLPVGISDFYLATYVTTTPGPIIFPVTFHAFYYDDIDEVYFVISYLDMYQFIALGKSTITLPGTGMWLCATCAPHSLLPGGSGKYCWRPCGVNYSLTGNSGTTSYTPAGLFWLRYAYEGSYNGPVHYAFKNAWLHSNLNTAYPWSLTNDNYSSSSNGLPVGITYASNHMRSQPQESNLEANLIPILVYRTHPSIINQYYLVASLVKSRHISINYLDPESILTKGSEQWMVFPCFKKTNAATYATSAGHLDSGNFGWAVKKEA